MKLQLGISLLLVLRGDAFTTPNGAIRTTTSRRSTPPPSIKRTRKYISIKPDGESSINGERIRNGLKRLLRKPEEPQEATNDAVSTGTRRRNGNTNIASVVRTETIKEAEEAEEDPITPTVLLSETNGAEKPEEMKEIILDPVLLSEEISEKNGESEVAIKVKDDEVAGQVLMSEQETLAPAMPSSETIIAKGEEENITTKSRTVLASWRKPQEEELVEESNLLVNGAMVGGGGAETSAVANTKEDVRDNKALHIFGLMAGTLWWYIFSSYEFLTKPDVFDIFDIYSSGNEWLYNGMSAYVTISQLCTYFFLWKLMTTRSLREGQFWIGLCIFACVPADTIVILFDPTGSKAATVVAFTLVTLIYGVILAYYLREAAALEPNPTNDIYKDDEGHNMIQEVIHYRPPEDLQNTHMAIDFARSFGAFTITVAAMREQLGIGEVGLIYYAVLFVVVAHAAMEMTMTTITPGLDLCKYKTFIKFQTFMALFEMFAATYIAHVAPEEDLTIWDDLVYSLLFGSAAAALQEFAALWGADTDFDSKLGMANMEIYGAGEGANNNLESAQ